MEHRFSFYKRTDRSCPVLSQHSKRGRQNASSGWRVLRVIESKLRLTAALETKEREPKGVLTALDRD